MPAELIFSLCYTLADPGVVEGNDLASWAPFEWGPTPQVARCGLSDDLPPVFACGGWRMTKQHATQVDLGVSIDIGAPLPHLVSDGLRAVVVFHTGLVPAIQPQPASPQLQR